jgi:hypothetical protein
MKTPSKILCGALVLAGLPLGLLTGCVGGGYVEGGGYDGPYYGGGWYDGTVVVGGGGWYHDHGDRAYVHPSNHPGAAHAAAPRGGGGGGGHRP